MNNYHLFVFNPQNRNVDLVDDERYLFEYFESLDDFLLKLKIRTPDLVLIRRSDFSEKLIDQKINHVLEEHNIPLYLVDAVDDSNRLFFELESIIQESKKKRFLREDLGFNLLEYFREGVIIIDDKNCIHYLNTAAEKMIGYSRKNVLGKAIDDSLALYERRTGGRIPNLECFLFADSHPFRRYAPFSLMLKNGTSLLVEVECASLSLYKMVILSDVTASYKIKYLNNIYEDVLSRVEGVFCLIQASLDEPRVVYCNDVFIKKIQKNKYFEESFLIYDLFLEDQKKHLINLLKSVIEKKIQISDRIILDCGSDSLSFFVTIHPIMDIDSQVIYCMINFEDVTREEKIVQELEMSQKIENIGRSTSAIAHDFNNLLGIIRSYVSLLEIQLTGKEKLLEYVSAIEKAAERGVGFIQQLMLFVKDIKPELSKIEVNSLFIDLRKMIEPLMTNNIKLDWICSSSKMYIQGNRSQIDQVLINLCVNARDAMGSGGVLRVTLSDTESMYQNIDTDKKSFLMISVEDTGVGMDEKTKMSIFKPFFSTKAPGKGTGLGLATVHSIIKEHGGYIELESEVGKGTVFRVYLPILKEAEYVL